MDKEVDFIQKDIRVCSVCEKDFDFNIEGLEGPNSVMVCSDECAVISAASRGKKVAIHDHDGRIVKTNVKF